MTEDALLECLTLEKEIVKVLLHESRRNDINRFLSGLRKPSKLTQELMERVSKIHEQRKKILQNLPYDSCEMMKKHNVT